MKSLGYGISACVGLIMTMSIGHVQAQEMRKTSLRLDFIATGYHAPFYLGIANGLYRQQGIDLKSRKVRARPTRRRS